MMPGGEGRPYVVARGMTTELLEDKVNELVRAGYAPTGGLAAAGQDFAQAMFLVSKMTAMMSGEGPP